MISRRDLLTAFLGSTVATSCLRASKSRPRVEGAMLDASAWAHHLRSDEKLPLNEAELEEVDVAIIGAGASGVSAAWRLVASGVTKFVILDLDERVGGTAQSGANAVTSYPWGAHYLPAPRSERGPVVKLLREMGLVENVDDRGFPTFAEEALVAAPQERLFYRGYWSEGLYLYTGASKEDLAELNRFENQMRQFSNSRDSKGRKAFDVPLSQGSLDSEWVALDQISMATWMERNRFRSSRLLWYVNYACRDDFGGAMEDISAYAAIWYFAARRESEKHSQGYLTWPEGNSRLIRAMLSNVEAHKLRLRALVHSIRPTREGLIIDWLDGALTHPRRLRARKAILAIPQFVTSRIWEPWRRNPPEHVKAFHYSPWVVANLLLRETPHSLGFTESWDNVFYESKSLGYVVATHQHQRAMQSGPSHWTWYYPMVGNNERVERQRMMSMGYEDWEEIVMSDLSASNSRIATYAKKLEIMRWGHAMVRPQPGFLFGEARQALSLETQGVYWAHTDIAGLPLFEEANHQGVTAAEKVLKSLGHSAGSWL